MRAKAGSVFIASLSTETNTFSPLPTGIAAFQEGGLFYGDASRVAPDGPGLWMRIFRDLAEADYRDVRESLLATAQPGGRTVRAVYETLRDRIVSDLGDVAEIGIVLLALHGAMMAEGYDDCEGDLLERVRGAVGPGVVVGVLLDPHCHLSDAMLAAADIIILMKEYPHTDFEDRARELYALCKATAAGEHRPVAAVFDCRMIGHYPTMLEPMAALVRDMIAAEAEPGLLSVSFVHGFPWGDSPDNGSKMLVFSDGDAAAATAAAERLGRAVYALRETFQLRYPTIDEALDRAMACDGPVIIADTADNAGGGAPGDATPLLRAMLARGGAPAVLGAIYDPGAVRLCEEAGLGARLSLRIGGKTGPASGDPLDIEATVAGLEKHHVQTFAGETVPMGGSAWVQVGQIGVVLCSIRSQVFSPDLFTGLGIDLAGQHIVAVKSSEHYRAGFAPMARHIIPIATPGALQADLGAIAYRLKRDLSFYPRVSDPLGVA